MKILLIGTGGVGEALATIIRNQDSNSEWMEQMVLADFNRKRAEKVATKLGGGRFVPEYVNARNNNEIIALAKKYNPDYIVNGCDPSFVPSIMNAAYDAGCNYLDFTCSWSVPHETKPYELTNVKVGDLQFNNHDRYKEKGLSGIIGVGADPGMVNVFAKYAEKYYFDQIREIHIRDGAKLEIEGVEVAFGFSIHATVEECLNPPMVYDKSKGGFYCTEPFADAEIFDFPEGIGPLEVVNIEHEEVAYVPKYIDCDKVTFKYCLGDEFISMLKYLKALNLNRSDTTIKIGECDIVPLDFVAKCAPNPVEIGRKMVGKTCVGTWVLGTKDGMDRSIFMYQSTDNQECLKRLDCQAVVAQTAFAPAITLELLAKGIWKDTGVYSLEYFDPDPFIKRMEAYGFPGAMVEKHSEYKKAMDMRALLEPMEQF